MIYFKLILPLRYEDFLDHVLGVTETWFCMLIGDVPFVGSKSMGNNRNVHHEKYCPERPVGVVM